MSEISKNAFYNDDTITTAIFGKECYSINDNVFEDCEYLIKINDDNHIRNIGNYAFKNATSLSEATFGELIDMGSGAFEGCEKLTNIVIPNCLEIPENAFSGCSSLVDFDFRGRINIGDNSFNGCAGLTEITLTQCQSIGSKAFKDCENITDVYINKSNNNIFCELKDVNAFLKNDGTIINENIRFHVNSDVETQYTENRNWGYYKDYIISEIGDKQIRYKTTDDVKIILKEGIDAKNEYSNGYGIITFDNDVISLNQIFTNGKERLTYIELPSSCKTIKESALSGCKGLKTIIMPNVETIENKAFENCKELTSFEMPENVTTLGEGIFAGCDNIAEFKGKFSTYGGRAIVYNNKLISVVSKDNSVTEGRIHNISEIDKNIDTLGAFCFEGCVNMRRIDIPSNIVNIKDDAFANCKNLYEIHLNRDHNNTTLNLGTNVFGGIEVDYKIFVQETELEKWIDKLNPYINNLYPKPRQNEIIYYIDETINTNIISGSKIIDISNNKYANGRYFKINASNNVVSTIFANRTNITKVITNEETIGISNGAFVGCKSLEYIYLSEQIKALNSRCFYACENLKRIHIPSKANFGIEIFVGCKNLNEFGTYYKGYVTDDNRCYISKDNNGYTTLMFFAGGGENQIEKYTIPDNINIIGESAFRGSIITDITIGTTTSKISEYAFANCVNLKTISNWDNVNIISKYAFNGCSKLGYGDPVSVENSGGITLPNKLTTIGEYAFQNCESMYINGNIPKSSRRITIGKYAFDGCSNLKCIEDKSTKEPVSLNLNNVLEINECVFRGCSSLTEVNIGNYGGKNGGKIGDSAFCNCTKLETVKNIPKLETVKNIQHNNIEYLFKLSIIGESAFKGCVELKTFTLPNTLTTIGAGAFEDCKKYNPTIPNSVSSLGDNCFKGTGIETLILSSTSNLKKIPNGAFKNCTSLTYIDIFNSKITKIGSGAFYNCENLEVKEGKEFFLPDGVTNISDSAFENCKGITYAYLPKSLRYLGNNSFLTNADSMKIYMQIGELLSNIPEFTLKGMPTSFSNPFGDLSNPNFVKKSINIFVPKSLSMVYINNKYWRKYISIIKEYT